MKYFFITIICLGTFLASFAAQAQVSSSEQAIIARFTAQYGAPIAITRGNYNGGLVIVKFEQAPDTIVVITIFPDGTFRLTRRPKNPKSTDDQESPDGGPVDSAPDDVVDSAPGDDSSPR